MKFSAPVKSLEELHKISSKPRNPHQDFLEKMGKMDRFAVWITSRIGTIGFFIFISLWTLLWLGWNVLAPVDLRFDPPTGFVFWLFISNMIQLFLMPLIMVGQNIENRVTAARAAHDLEVNIKAEKEIEIIIKNLEYQQQMLLDIARKLGIADAN